MGKRREEGGKEERTTTQCHNSARKTSFRCRSRCRRRRRRSSRLNQSRRYERVSTLCVSEQTIVSFLLLHHHHHHRPFLSFPPFIGRRLHPGHYCSPAATATSALLSIIQWPLNGLPLSLSLPIHFHHFNRRRQRRPSMITKWPQIQQSSANRSIQMMAMMRMMIDCLWWWTS